MTAQEIDLIVIGFIALAALFGLATGAVRIALGAVCTALVVALMLYGYRPLAAAIEGVTPLSPRLAMLAAFAVLAVAGQAAVIGLLQRLIQPVLRAVRGRAALRHLDAILGLAAGAVVGSQVAALLLAPLAISAPNLDLGAALRDARFSATLLEGNARAIERLRLRQLLQPAAETLALPAPLATNETGRELPFRLAPDELVDDPAAEAQLLALVNGERASVGLPALAADPALVPVARAHGAEMFALGYFAHESPVTGDPFDRLAAAGIGYRSAGENLAFAPDVPTAHRGLMNSPGHRANILNAEFGRVGIGIVRSRYHGLMVVQEFRD